MGASVNNDMQRYPKNPVLGWDQVPDPVETVHNATVSNTGINS